MSIKVADDVRALLERVRDGGKLRKSERIRALESLELLNELTAPQLAQLLGVSTRTIRSDRAELRRRYEQAARDLALVGELYREWRITMSRIDQAIANENWKRVRALVERWGVVTSFFDRLQARGLEERIARLEETLGVGI